MASAQLARLHQQAGIWLRQVKQSPAPAALTIYSFTGVKVTGGSVVLVPGIEDASGGSSGGDYTTRGRMPAHGEIVTPRQTTQQEIQARRQARLWKQVMREDSEIVAIAVAIIEVLNNDGNS